MKILLSAFGFDPYRGSELATGWNWAHELVRAGHQVWVLTTPLGKANVERYLRENPTPNLHVTFVAGTPQNPLFGPFRILVRAVQWQRSALEEARRLDAEIDFDLVHHVSWGSLHIGSHLWRLGKPFVFGPVGGGQVAPAGYRRYLRGGWVMEIIRSAVVSYLSPYLLSAKSTVSHADLVFVANQETRALVEKLGAARIEDMPAIGAVSSWLQATPPALPQQDGALKILWIGRLLPRKGVLLALEAMAQIDPDIRFSCTILGDGKQGKFIRRWIEELELSDRVTWKGSVPYAEAIEAYTGHDVMLFTSLRDTDGNQLLEALAHGAAVVTLDHQGAGVVVTENTGIKVPVSTPGETAHALARALERLAKEPLTLAAMQRNAIRSAAEHEWRKRIERALALYPVADKPHRESAPRRLSA